LIELRVRETRAIVVSFQILGKGIYCGIFGQIGKREIYTKEGWTRP